MKNELNIMKYIPEISDIKNPDIREKTIKVWEKLWEMSKFEKIEDLPVNPNTKHSHIIHNRSVIRMALAVAKILEEQHGIKVDTDILISAAALQDSSKLVEYQPTQNGIELSEIGKEFQHGFYAGHIALNMGLPREISVAMISHTYDNSKFPPNLISKILFYVDQIDTAALGVDRWKKTSFIYR